jgi:hypothetical protein
MRRVGFALIAPSQIPSTVRTTITNYEGLLQNTNFREVIAAVDGDALQRDMLVLTEALATIRRAEQYRDSLQYLKACFTELPRARESPRFIDLSPDAASDYAAIAKIACGAAQRAGAAVRHVNDLFDAAGLSDFLSTHGATLFWQFPYNPFFGPPIVRLLEAVGISERDIEREHPAYGELGDWDWDLLRLRDNDGTFSGLVDQFDQELRAFEERAQNAIPAIEGREPIAFIIAVVIIIVVGYCLVSHNCGFEIDDSPTQ